MENGLSIYYPGNTVIAPNPGRKRREKVINPDKQPEFEAKIMDAQHKVCAVSKCVWCGATAGGQWFITCPNCSNCQYCGMVDNVDPHRCFICGNYLPDEARNTLERVNAATVNYYTDLQQQEG